TPGAYPGMEAEARGQGEAIAQNLAQMSRLRTPVCAVITGEGSSGGALALGVADRVLMLEHAFFSVVSPEGFASILWKDASRRAQACELMRLTARDMLAFGIADEIVPEPRGGAQRDPHALYAALDDALCRALSALEGQNGQERAAQRCARYRRMGL
ncbi:MAG: carboxyl transferase domain-containing protein, partial [Clostridia bacterium]|nr:carboxyl transferase domain-containing protein [Clostridia bacterium]